MFMIKSMLSGYIYLVHRMFVILLVAYIYVFFLSVGLFFFSIIRSRFIVNIFKNNVLFQMVINPVEKMLVFSFDFSYNASPILFVVN